MTSSPRLVSVRGAYPIPKSTVVAREFATATHEPPPGGKRRAVNRYRSWEGMTAGPPLAVLLAAQPSTAKLADADMAKLKSVRTDDKRPAVRLPSRQVWGIACGKHPWRAGNEDGNDSRAADPKGRGPRRSTWRIPRASPGRESARPRGAPACTDDTARQRSPELARSRRCARDT